MCCRLSQIVIGSNRQSYLLCLPRVSCEGAVFDLVGDLPNAAQCVVEELFVTLAKVALFFVETGSVFDTASAAIVQMSADEAFVADILFVAGEGSFDFALSQFG